MMKKNAYQHPELRFVPLRPELNFLSTTEGNIGDWGEDMDPINF